MEKLFNMRQSIAESKGLFDLIKHTELDNIVMVEIGCFQGESTSILAQHDQVKKIYCIDPWVSGYDRADRASRCDMNEVEVAFDERMKPFEEKIIKLKMKSSDAITYFLDNNIKVDLVYIDGNHGESAVIDDINNYKQIIKEGMFISGHDWQHPPVRRAVEKTLGNIDGKFKDNSWVVKL